MLKSDSLSSQNGRTFNDFNKFMRELPFLFMLEHGLEHTQDFSISCSRCFITSPEFEHSVKARLEHETVLN